MKKEWVRPQTLIESFAANEYIAACGDSGTVYKFTCNAPAGPLYYYPQSDGTIDGNYTGNGKKDFLGLFYHPCNEGHDASVTDDFYDGFVDYNLNTRHDDGESVIVWLGKEGNNGHATKNLNKKDWETAKS